MNKRTHSAPRRRGLSFLLDAPYVLWSALFIVIPLVIVVFYSFTDAEGNFTFENISAISNYGTTIRISIEYSVIATLITLVISYPFAYFMTKTSANAQRTQMLLVMLPMWMNLLIRTYAWMNILEKNGIINRFIMLLGGDPLKLLGTPAAVIFGMVYNYLPYMILPIYTVMSKLDPSLLDAASDLGSNAFQRILRVIFPLSVPGVVSGVAMVFVPSISTFYISQKLGSGKILLIGDTVERFIKTSYNYNMGAALSLLLMVIILVCMFVMNRFSSDDEEIVV